MSDFVRVQTENGMFASVPRAHAVNNGLDIVDEPATSTAGDPLPESGPNDEGAASPFDGKSVAELKAEIDQRNADRPEDQQIPKGRSKAELVAALTAADL